MPFAVRPVLGAGVGVLKVPEYGNEFEDDENVDGRVSRRVERWTPV